MLGACEDRYISRDRHRVARKDHVEIEWGAMHLPACQAMPHTDAVRVAACLKPHLAASAPAFLDRVCHLGWWAKLAQPRLIDRGADEGGEQRVRLEWPRFELWVELHADEPGMIWPLDNLRQQTVRRETAEAQAGGL